MPPYKAFVVFILGPCFLNSVSLDWTVDYERINHDPVHKWEVSCSLSDDETEGFFLFNGDEEAGGLNIFSASAGFKSDFFSLGPVAWGPVYRKFFGLSPDVSRGREPFCIVRSESFNRSAAFFRKGGVTSGFIRSGDMSAATLDLGTQDLSPVRFGFHSLLGSEWTGSAEETDWILDHPPYPGLLLHSLLECRYVNSSPLSGAASLITARGKGFPLQYGFSGEFCYTNGPVLFYQDVLFFAPGYVSPERNSVSGNHIRTQIDYKCESFLISAVSRYEKTDEGERLLKEAVTAGFRLNDKYDIQMKISAEHGDAFLTEGFGVSLSNRLFFTKYGFESNSGNSSSVIHRLESGVTLDSWILKGAIESRSETRDYYSFSLLLNWKGPRITFEDSVSIKDWAVPRRYGEVPDLIHSYRLEGQGLPGLYN